MHTHTHRHDVGATTSPLHDHRQGHSYRLEPATPRRPRRQRAHANPIESATSPRQRRWRHHPHRRVTAAFAVIAAIITPAVQRRRHAR
jgi:hypothetical protein